MISIIDLLAHKAKRAFILAWRSLSPLNFSHYNILKCIHQTVKYLIQFSEFKILFDLKWQKYILVLIINYIHIILICDKLSVCFDRFLIFSYNRLGLMWHSIFMKPYKEIFLQMLATFDKYSSADIDRQMLHKIMYMYTVKDLYSGTTI